MLGSHHSGSFSHSFKRFRKLKSDVCGINLAVRLLHLYKRSIHCWKIFFITLHRFVPQNILVEVSDRLRSLTAVDFTPCQCSVFMIFLR